MRQSLLECNTAYRRSHVNAPQPRRVCNNGLIAALLYNALLWAGIWWTVAMLFH